MRPLATLPLDPPLVELDELLEEELDELDELEELEELLPVGVPEEVVPPPQPTRRMQPASTPPVTLSNLLILYILFSTSNCWLLIYYKCHRVPAG